MRKGVLILAGLLMASPLSAKNLIPTLAAKGLPQWELPKIQKKETANGFRLYTLTDKTLPLFQATLFVQAGEAYLSHKKSGLAGLHATVLVTGGTQKKEPRVLDEWLEERSIHLWADTGRELMTVHVRALAHQWEEALNILREAAFEPRWDENRFELAKSRLQEDLRREKDQPNAVLARTFRRTLYGKKHPWGHLPTRRSVKKIKRADLPAFHQKYFHPNRMLLTVAGDFSPAQIKKWAAKNFEGLEQGKIAEPQWEVRPFGNRSRTKKIKRPVNQVFIEAGHFGLLRHQEERYAYHLLQYILGGEVFTSRLGRDIRTERGLAYSVYSNWEATPARGHFSIHVETKKESADLVRQRILEHLQRLHEKADIAPEELERAKEALLNQYIFWFDSVFGLVNAQAKFDRLGFSPDYLRDYPKKIRAVTLEEVQKTAKEYLQPDRLTWVMVTP